MDDHPDVPEVVSAQLTHSGAGDPILRLGVGDGDLEFGSIEIRYSRATVHRLTEILATNGDLPNQH